MNENSGGIEPTRRQVMESLLLLSVLGAAVGESSPASAQAQTVQSAEKHESLRKTLIERLINTRYYVAEDGSVVVQPDDEVWRGESGGAYHADWLFNPLDGLVATPREALEAAIVSDRVHKGIQLNTDLTLVTQILENAKQLGLFDDIAIVYQVMREKFCVETFGAYAKGVEQFRNWVSVNTALTGDQRNTIDAAAASFLNVAHPHTSHTPY